MVFHWSLSDSKSPLVSRTRLRILAVISNAVVWIVSTSPPTSKSSMPFNNPLVIVPKAPITIGNRYFHVPQLFQISSKVEVLILLFTYYYYYYYSLQEFRISISFYCKFLRVSKTLPSIFSELNNSVVWMVSARSLISNFISPPQPYYHCGDLWFGLVWFVLLLWHIDHCRYTKSIFIHITSSISNNSI